MCPMAVRRSEAVNAALKPLPRVTYGVETIAEVIAEIIPLLDAHWDEIAHFRDIPLSPDWARYRMAENARALRIFTARADGALVGYAIFFVMRAPHYNVVQADQDILFLLPEYRRGLTGLALIKHADKELKHEGVTIVMHHVKAAHDFGPLLEHLGYEPVDRLYAKRLDR